MFCLLFWGIRAPYFVLCYGSPLCARLRITRVCTLSHNMRGPRIARVEKPKILHNTEQNNPPPLRGGACLRLACAAVQRGHNPRLRTISSQKIVFFSSTKIVIYRQEVFFSLFALALIFYFRHNNPFFSRFYDT